MTTPLIPDAERAAFEAHFDTMMLSSDDEPTFNRNRFDRYESSEVQLHWQTWQAARRELLARQVPDEPTPAMVKAMVLSWLSQLPGDTWDECAIAAWKAGVAASRLPDNSAFSKPDRAPYEDGKSAGSKPSEP